MRTGFEGQLCAWAVATASTAAAAPSKRMTSLIFLSDGKISARARRRVDGRADVRFGRRDEEHAARADHQTATAGLGDRVADLGADRLLRPACERAVLLDAADQELGEALERIAQGGRGETVVPVDQSHRVVGEEVEHHVLAVHVQEIEPAPALERGEELEVEALAETQVLGLRRHAIARALRGEEEAVRARRQRSEREFDRDIGDDPQARFERLGLATHVGEDPFAGELAGGSERAEDGLQDRRAAAELARGEPQRLDLLPEHALARIEPREARPVLGAGEARLHHRTSAVHRALVRSDRAPVLDAVGAGRHELYEVEVPLALPRHHVAGELRGIEIVFGEMPPQADRQPVDRLARGGSFDALPVIHEREFTCRGRRSPGPLPTRLHYRDAVSGRWCH